MSRRLVVRLLLASLILISAASVRVALASVDALTAFSAQALRPSATPDLLGPITEAGRVGWACHPEQAAMAQRAREAELPSTETP